MKTLKNKPVVGRRTIAKITLFAILSCLFFTTYAQVGTCRDCSIPSFGAITLYHIAQPHSNFGFGMEAGKWNKEDSRFSYFMGAKLEWFRLVPGSDKFNNSAGNIHFSVYMKGQFELMDRFYVVVSPEFVNLSSLDAEAGFRYTFPISTSIGIGVEPAYSFIQRQYSLNTNIHFALR